MSGLVAPTGVAGHTVTVAPRLTERPATGPTSSWADTVRTRRAIRAFRADPVDAAVIDEMLYEASLSPSNCNTQPWLVRVVSRPLLSELGLRLTDDFDNGRWSADYDFDPTLYQDEFQRRRREHGEVLHGAAGVSRDDAAGRLANTRRNFDFFGAPHAAFLFMPHVGDGIRVAFDVGMFAQTLLLALTARGLGGIPQTILGMCAGTVRRVLDVPPEERLLIGISFGRIDEHHPANGAFTDRDARFISQQA